MALNAVKACRLTQKHKKKLQENIKQIIFGNTVEMPVRGCVQIWSKLNLSKSFVRNRSGAKSNFGENRHSLIAISVKSKQTRQN